MACAAKLDYEGITLTDNYMFVTVFSDPERCRQLLERVLGMRIRKVVLTVGEKALAPAPGSHGIRMDVYAQDDAGTVYDVEMQKSRKGELGLRSRYYQSTIDGDLLETGLPYRKLRKSLVIFICTYDPFERGLPRYTFAARCAEAEFSLDDRTSRIFINATAWEKCREPRLRAFLHYLESGIIDDDDSFVRDVDAVVNKTRERHEWRVSRMKWEQYILEERAEAAAEAEARGEAQGEARGAAKMGLLAEALVADGRPELIAQAVADHGLFERLLERYGISDGLVPA